MDDSVVTGSALLRVIPCAKPAQLMETRYPRLDTNGGIMARFYGEISGARGAVSRMGHSTSGFWGHIRGWAIGAEIRMNAQGDADVCRIAVTSGSNGRGGTTSLGYATRDDDGNIVFYPSETLCAALGVKYHVHNQGAKHPFRRAILSR